MVDFNINKDKPTLIRERDLILQQLDILFDTDEDEVFGEEYGTHFEEFLFNLDISNAYISDYVRTKISENVNLFDWQLEVDTQIAQGTLNDIILVRITLRQEYDEFEKIYRIR